MSSKSEILKVRDLTVDFPIFGGILKRKVSAVHAVKKVSYDLIKGETLGIVGESGSGKSTLGNAILNVLTLTAPEVSISGKISLVLDSKEDRDKFLEFTNKNGVMTRPIWTLMSKLSMFKDCQTDGLKNSLWLEDRVVNIPSSVPNEIL